MMPEAAAYLETPQPAAPRVTHHFSVDVEEYFQVSAFEALVPRDRWDGFDSRLHTGMPLLLDLLARSGSRATFFVLGWVARRHPQVVRDIVGGGHEIASHGWDHARVTAQTPAEFRVSVRRTKQVLEDLTGVEVQGFRAPSFSIVPGLEWAFDELLGEGYQYDSSLFPIRRPGKYGYPGARPDPHWLSRPSGRLAEVPIATWRRLGLSLPAGGGGYFRFFPYELVRAAFRDCERRGAPGTFYVHPWELDPDQPRLNAPWHARFRHYTGLHRTRARLERLCTEFRFSTIASTVAAM
jgi:polysaccharide deacetylase family protein (PEP-CTERM system associated)